MFPDAVAMSKIVFGHASMYIPAQQSRKKQKLLSPHRQSPKKNTITASLCVIASIPEHSQRVARAPDRPQRRARAGFQVHAACNRPALRRAHKQPTNNTETQTVRTQIHTHVHTRLTQNQQESHSAPPSTFSPMFDSRLLVIVTLATVTKSQVWKYTPPASRENEHQNRCRRIHVRRLTCCGLRPKSGDGVVRRHDVFDDDIRTSVIIQPSCKNGGCRALSGPPTRDRRGVSRPSRHGKDSKYENTLRDSQSRGKAHPVQYECTQARTDSSPPYA